MAAQTETIRQLRSALNHLYDLPYLKRSPLAASLIKDGSITISQFQKRLIDAIETLKPAQHVPHTSKSWLIYDLLRYCYIEQFTQEEVALQLGISDRQLRREQVNALEAIASHLQTTFHIRRNTASVPPEYSEDFNWVDGLTVEQPTRVPQVLAEIFEFLRPLAEKNHVSLGMQIDEDLPGLTFHPLLLRQIMISLLSVAIRLHPGEVTISANKTTTQVILSIEVSTGSENPLPLSEGEIDNLQYINHLAERTGARLDYSKSIGSFPTRLFLPAKERQTILVVDDNNDALQLLQRYTDGTPFNLIPMTDPDQVLETAQRVHPDLILLDVMMPRMDGWELLSHLRHHPLTCDIPVIVCTVLAQEDLALSVGAVGFLRKPFTQEILLATLHRFGH